MSHSYVSLNDFKSHGRANLATNVDDAALLVDLEAHSRQLERIIGGRRFFPTTETHYFSGNGKNCLPFPKLDLIGITTLKEDTNRDGTYETTWASTDYLLAPDNNDPTSFIDPLPYWEIQVDQRSTGAQDAFLKGQRMYELVGTWGYCNLTEDTTATVGETYTSTDLTLTVSDGSKVSIGDTLLIESEHLYVTGKTVPGNSDLTVRRGMNGTTAASHASGTAISKYVYPEPIVKAVILQVQRLRMRGIAGYADQAGFDNTGAFTPQVGVDQDWWQLVQPYKKFNSI